MKPTYTVARKGTEDVPNTMNFITGMPCTKVIYVPIAKSLTRQQAKKLRESYNDPTVVFYKE